MKRILFILLLVLCVTIPLCSCEAVGVVAETNADSSDTVVSSDGIYRLLFDGDKYTYTGDRSAISVKGSVITVKKGASFELSGTLKDGQLIVDVSKSERVTLIFNNVNMSCSVSAPIYIKSADKVIVELADGSMNTLSDAEKYVYEAGTVKPNACLYSDIDLTLRGDGSLTVNGNSNNGIGCKNDLKIKGGNITVNAVNNAINSNGSVSVEDGIITIAAASDGIKAESTESEKGFISINGGTLNITCSDDALQTSLRIAISGGKATLKPSDKNYICKYENDAGETVDGTITITAEGWPAVE